MPEVEAVNGHALAHARVNIPKRRRKPGPPVVIPVYRSVFHFHRQDGTIRLSREEWRNQPATGDKTLSPWGRTTHTGCKKPVCLVQCPPGTRTAGINDVSIPLGRHDGKIRRVAMRDLISMAQTGDMGCRFLEDGEDVGVEETAT